jgi:hypothetical protein
VRGSPLFFSMGDEDAETLVRRFKFYCLASAQTEILRAANLSMLLIRHKLAADSTC